VHIVEPGCGEVVCVRTEANGVGDDLAIALGQEFYPAVLIKPVGTKLHPLASVPTLVDADMGNACLVGDAVQGSAGVGGVRRPSGRQGVFAFAGEGELPDRCMPVGRLRRGAPGKNAEGVRNHETIGHAAENDFTCAVQSVASQSMPCMTPSLLVDRDFVKALCVVDPVAGIGGMTGALWPAGIDVVFSRLKPGQ